MPRAGSWSLSGAEEDGVRSRLQAHWRSFVVLVEDVELRGGGAVQTMPGGRHHRRGAPHGRRPGVPASSAVANVMERVRSPGDTRAGLGPSIPGSLSFNAIGVALGAKHVRVPGIEGEHVEPPPDPLVRRLLDANTLHDDHHLHLLRRPSTAGLIGSPVR